MTDKPKTLPNLSKDFSISDKDSKIFNANLDKVNAMNKPKVSAELSERQFAVKAIHEDRLNVKNPSVLAKLLKEFAESFAKQEVKKACKGKDETMTCASCHAKDVEKRYVCNDCGVEWI